MPQTKLTPVYETAHGEMYQASIEDFLKSRNARHLRGKVQLIFTSPPFPLLREKEYGNRVGAEYVEWLASLAEPLRDLLTTDGSLVIEIGNAWEKGRPVMSTLPLEALMGFLNRSGMHLCQQFIAHNPARLPSPAQWVNVERIRVKDSFTNIWWMGKEERPKASNERVLTPYSASMKKLLERGDYNGGARPSQHMIGESSFLVDNGGAIPPSVLTVSNTRSKSAYTAYCRANEIKPHPARMPFELADFFIRFLTDPDDLVLDPFSGSNTTGAVAEVNGRRWVSLEKEARYIDGSRGHFKGKESNQKAA